MIRVVLPYHLRTLARVGKGGVVRDQALRRAALASVEAAARELAKRSGVPVIPGVSNVTDPAQIVKWMADGLLAATDAD